jgi:hypothetical protein
LHLRSGRREHEAAKARPLTKHLIVSIAWGLEMRFLTVLCGLRVSVEKYNAPKDPCSASAVNAPAIRSGTAATHPGMLLVVRLTSQGSAATHSSSLSAAAVEETTQPTTGAV